MAQMAVLLPASIKILINALNQSDVTTESVPLWVKSYEFWPPLEERLKDHFFVVKCVAYFLPIYFLIYGIMRYTHFYIVKYVAERMTNAVRYQIMDRFLSLSPTFYQTRKTGSGGLLSRTLNDTMVIQESIQFYSDLIREPIYALALTVYLFYLNWKLSLFCLIFLPIFSSIIRIITGSLKKLHHTGQAALDDVVKNLKEGLDGMRVIQSYNLEEDMRSKFQSTIGHYNSLRRKIIKRMELASPINEFLASLFLTAIILWVGQLIFGGAETVGGFIAFLVAAGALNAPVKKIQQALVRLPGVTVSIDRIFEIIDSKEEVHQLAEPKPFPKNWKTIEYKDVSFSYGDEQVLNKINLQVKRGEIIALVGESGSGKSTVVNLLERFFDPESGHVLIDGVPITEMPLADLRDNIALVTQDVFLFNDTLESNIRAGNNEKSFEKVVEAATKANALKFIETLPNKFNTLAGERGTNFSGGEKQRLSIARAIFKDAPILILDEATSALDSASEVEVQEGIQSLMAGRTAFVIAHRLSTISKADRILVMSKGKIVEEGKHEELLSSKGLYAHYYDLQFR